MPTSQATLLDRLYPPHLTAGQLVDYLAHHLPYVRTPLILLGPFGSFAALTLYALNPGLQGQVLQELTHPVALTLLVLQACCWGWMVAAKRMEWFSRASLAFLACFYGLVAWLSHGDRELLLWLIPQFLVWQLAIAPLALKPRTFVGSLVITIVAPLVLLAGVQASPTVWATLILHLLGIGVVASIVFRAANRTRRETFLATQHMREVAFNDSLTGMLTRRRFFELANRSYLYAEDHGWPICVCFIDLDNFKRLNDQYGHAFGDRVLTDAARCFQALGDQLNNTTQERPAARHVIPGRMGGEEFALLLVGYQQDEARAVAEWLLGRLRALQFDEVRVTASAGVAQRQPGEGLGALLHRADLALLEAKRTGKDRVVEATALMPEQPQDSEALHARAV